MTNKVDPLLGKNKSPELEAFAGLEASPLVTQSLIDRIKARNPENIVYWGNSGAAGGLRLTQLVYSGFQVAKPEDIVYMGSSGPVAPPPEIVKNGRIVMGDTTCLVISKKKYYGALKHNHNEAFRRSQASKRDVDAAAQKARKEMVGGAPNEIAAKIRTFTPSEEDLEKLTGNN